MIRVRLTLVYPEERYELFYSIAGRHLFMMFEKEKIEYSQRIQGVKIFCTPSGINNTGFERVNRLNIGCFKQK